MFYLAKSRSRSNRSLKPNPMILISLAFIIIILAVVLLSIILYSNTVDLRCTSLSKYFNCLNAYYKNNQLIVNLNTNITGYIAFLLYNKTEINTTELSNLNKSLDINYVYNIIVPSQQHLVFYSTNISSNERYYVVYAICNMSILTPINKLPYIISCIEKNSNNLSYALELYR
ncbi:MAG: putative ABC transporter permease [Candidatus Micrarchaeota archaeon]|nr:MAG: putative ABC transporter permease [Candidatus Micrarchaeota archaeon]